MMTQTMVAAPTDAELVQHVLNGQRDAYAQLVNRHQDLVYHHACGMGLDHDTSADLTQDAFIKAYHRLRDCHDPACFRAWVFRIARNLCLDYLKNVRRLTVPFSALPNADRIRDAHDDDPETRKLLRDALETLPVAMREAFLLKHDAGYTYEEIAEMTNATPSAVKMRVHRAREALRDYLIERGVRAA